MADLPITQKFTKKIQTGLTFKRECTHFKKWSNCWPTSSRFILAQNINTWLRNMSDLSMSQSISPKHLQNNHSTFHFSFHSYGSHENFRIKKSRVIVWVSGCRNCQASGLIQMGAPLSQIEEKCLKEERKDESLLKVIFFF